MKFIHLADLHIGKVINEFSMLEDQRYILTQILEIIQEEKVDTLLLAGDIYDRSVPSAEAVELMDWFLTETARLCTAVFLISGNHDSGERLSFGRSLFHGQQVYIEGGLERVDTPMELEDEYGSIFIYQLPFFRPAQLKGLGAELHDRDYEKAVQWIIEKMNPDPNRRNILLTHHFVVNRMGTATTKESQNAIGVECSDSENRLSVGGIEQVGYQCFKDFDYVALGHLHGPQKVGRETVRYAGSPLKYSFSEEFHQKSVVLFDIKKKGDITWKLIPLKPFRDMRRIKGKLEDLTKESIVISENAEDYIGVTLTDTEELFDAMGELRACYPNIMQLTFEKPKEKESHAEKVFDIEEQKTPVELVKTFLETVSDEEIKESYGFYINQWIEEILCEQEEEK